MAGRTPPGAGRELNLRGRCTRLLTVADLASLPPPAWLIDGYLEASALTMLYGPPNTGKSFVALDLALSIAHGIAWNEANTSAGMVVYVAAEGSRGLKRRVDAWYSEHQPESDAEILFLPDPINLFEHDADELIGATRDLDVVLFIFDTLSRCSVGADENAARDMAGVVDKLTAITRVTSAATLIVHHSGKNTGRGARGSTVLDAAADRIIELGRSHGNFLLRSRKAKDAEDFKPVAGRLVKVMESMVPHYISGDSTPTENLAHREVLVLTYLMQQGASGARFREIVQAIRVAERSLARSLKRLTNAGLIEKGPGRLDPYVITESGRGATAT
jgi:hypothetical protein